MSESENRDASPKIRTPAALPSDQAEQIGANHSPAAEADSASGLAHSTDKQEIDDVTSSSARDLFDEIQAYATGAAALAMHSVASYAPCTWGKKQHFAQHKRAVTSTGSVSIQNLREGTPQSTRDFKDRFVTGLTLSLEIVTMALAASALGIDTWLTPFVGEDVGSEERIMAGTKWAAAHATKAGFWSVCFDDGVVQLSKRNAFYSREGGYCSRNVSDFYADQVYGYNCWHHNVTAGVLGIAFVIAAIAGLGVSVLLAFAVSGPCTKWLSDRTVYLQSARCVLTATQVLLGYGLAGVLIWQLKGLKDARQSTTHLFASAAGVSMWLWIAAIVAMAMRICIRNAVVVARELATLNEQLKPVEATVTKLNVEKHDISPTKHG